MRLLEETDIDGTPEPVGSFDLVANLGRDGTDATTVDIYGVIGVNGDGEVWDYTDSYAVRNGTVGQGTATFTPGEWTFAGLNGLEDPGGDPAETILLQTLTTPGSHTCP